MINFQRIQDTRRTVNRLRSFLSLGPTNTTSLIQHNPTSALQCLQKNIIVINNDLCILFCTVPYKSKILSFQFHNVQKIKNII